MNCYGRMGLTTRLQETDCTARPPPTDDGGREGVGTTNCPRQQCAVCIDGCDEGGRVEGASKVEEEERRGRVFVWHITITQSKKNRSVILSLTHTLKMQCIFVFYKSNFFRFDQIYRKMHQSLQY